jgi:hypothetical protein
MLGPVMERIRGKAPPAGPTEGGGDELDQALGRLAQQRSQIAGRIIDGGADAPMALRQELELVAIDEAALAKARATRGGLLPGAASVIRRVLGRAAADVDPELARIEGEIKQLRRAGEVEADRLRELILTGMGRGPKAAEAEAGISAVRARLAELGKRQGVARQALNERRAAISGTEKAQQAATRAAKPRRLAELRQRIAQRAETLDGHWEGIAQEMADDDADRAEVADLLGLAGGGFFTQSAFRARAKGAAARALVIDTSRTMDEGNSLLGVKSPFADQRARWSLAQHTAEALTTELLFFETRPEAEAAAEGLAAIGAEMIVVPVGGAFTLVGRHHAFVDRAEAAQALEEIARTKGPLLAVVDPRVGCAILPSHLVE